MDRNSIIGMVLIFVILISFAYINQPSQAEIDAQKHKQDSIALVNQVADSINKAQQTLTVNAAPVVKDSTEIQNQFGDFAQFANGKTEITTLENEQLRISFTNKG